MRVKIRKGWRSEGSPPGLATPAQQWSNWEADPLSLSAFMPSPYMNLNLIACLGDSEYFSATEGPEPGTLGSLGSRNKRLCRTIVTAQQLLTIESGSKNE